ncbi:MAG: endonuclease III [Synergistaceae bacterium]|jgi:endonuclease-3|nr:endonuclease III [Synergistaceae bacterium]
MSRITATRTTIDADGGISARKPRPPEAKAREFGSIEHILLVLDRLESAYGHESQPADIYATGEPLDGLMLTLLSQNTNDRNRDAAYESLRSRFPSWGDVAAADQSEIEASIRPAGLGNIKAGRMKAILGEIESDFGGHTLAAMKEWDAARVREYLSGLHGIGPKTVACVMAFDLGLPAFPVDTHIARISRRLGWVSPRSAPEKIQLHLEGLVPPERCGGGHLNMIEHGRKKCRARGQVCASCPLSDACKENALFMVTRR